jgi:tripartite ATP-independent transporter DctP family solute receptor
MTTGSSAFAAPIVLKAADNQAADYPTVLAIEHMAKSLSAATQNQIQDKVFASGQLGDEKETIEQTIFGVIDINRVNIAPLASIAPEVLVPTLPFLFRNQDHMRSTLDGPIGDEILASLEAKGLIGLAFYDSGSRSFYNSKRPIKTPADLKGLKFRVQNSDLFVSMVESLGANATPMEFGQVFEGLKTGVIDGAENNWPSYESTHHFEAAKFYSTVEHTFSPEVLVMSKASWKKLTPEQQQVVRKSAKESVPFMRKLWDERVAKARKNVEAAGVKVNTDIDQKAFVEAVQPVYKKFVTTDQQKKLVERIKEVR